MTRSGCFCITWSVLGPALLPNPTNSRPAVLSKLSRSVSYSAEQSRDANRPDLSAHSLGAASGRQLLRRAGWGGVVGATPPPKPKSAGNGAAKDFLVSVTLSNPASSP